TAGVERDVGVRDRWDVVVAEPEEDVAVQLGREAGAVPGQQRVDVCLAGPSNGLRIVDADDGRGHVGAMQPAVVRLAWCEAVYVVPGLTEERLRLLDGGLPQDVGVVDGLALRGADSRDRNVLLAMREAQQRHGVVAAVAGRGGGGEARAE